MAGELLSGTIPLSKTTKFIVDNRGRTAPTVEYGIPLIATNCISNDQLYPAYEKLRFVSKETYANWFRSHPLPGDIILTNKGSQNGAICLVPDPVDFVIAQDMVALRADEKIIDPLFLFAALRSAEVQREIKNLDVSGVIPHFKKTDFDKLHLPYPKRDDQEAIGRIYFDFCAKIELNRRMNATLEAMARALFQSWFVDFDPVRAKLDGRVPVGMDAETAALFPEHLEDSPLGHIPKGWKAGTVVEGFNLTMGQSPPGDTYNEEGNGLPFYQGRTDFGFRFPKRRIYCTAPNRYAAPGDTLVSVRAPVGDINMASEECCIGRGVAAVRHKSGARSFTYQSMANIYPDFARFEAEGTVFGSINKDSFEKLRFIIPPTEIVAAYERQAGPLDEQIRILENQSRTLANLRDTLLPKLLSGKLSVAGLESNFAATQ
jgi:type I restriction enzyme S subunit